MESKKPERQESIEERKNIPEKEEQKKNKKLS